MKLLVLAGIGFMLELYLSHVRRNEKAERALRLNNP
jgi:hypothetical protein